MSDELELKDYSKQADFNSDTVAILTSTGRIIRVYRSDKGIVTGWHLNVSGQPIMPGWAIKDLFGAIPLKEKTYRVTIEAMVPIRVEVDVKASSENWAVEDACDQLMRNKLQVNTNFTEADQIVIDPPSVVEL